ncbi:MAG: hypothetical protein ACRD3V_17690 [Vicinamibacteria bacterium]
MMIAVPAFALALALDATVLDNDYVRVVRGGAPCASAKPGCGDRVLVALGPVYRREGGAVRKMTRGDIAVFEAGRIYAPPASGDYAEVNFKPSRPKVQSPKELIAPDKNSILYDGERFFVFEEKLEPEDVRERHSHSQRVVIVINETRLQQWPEGSPEIFKEQVPDTIKFNQPVIHVVKNVGDKPLRNIVIELKPER